MLFLSYSALLPSYLLKVNGCYFSVFSNWKFGTLIAYLIFNCNLFIILFTSAFGCSSSQELLFHWLVTTHADIYIYSERERERVVFLLLLYPYFSFSAISLQLSNYSSFEGVLYCKPHFDQLFKMTGSLDKSFEGDWLFWVVLGIFTSALIWLICLFHMLFFPFPPLQVLQELLELTDLPIRYLKAWFC